MRLRAMTLSIGCVLVLMGCAGDDDDDADADEAYYSDVVYYDPYWYTYDAALSYTWVDPWGVTYFEAASEIDSASARPTKVDLAALATGIANVATTRFTPAGCASAAASGATVEMDFADCRGPLALGSISGHLTVALSESNGQVTLTSTSRDLTVNDSPFVIDSVATITSAGTQRSLSVVSRSRSTQRVDSRDAQFTVTWTQGSGCVDVNGQSSTARGDRTATSTLQGYRRCANECPTAGTLTVVSEGRQYTATFDGSNSLHVTLPDGDTTTVPLGCS